MMNNRNLEHKKLETAIILARMYGMKENLEPLPCISNEKMVALILKWTEEYFDIGEEDIDFLRVDFMIIPVWEKRINNKCKNLHII